MAMDPEDLRVLRPAIERRLTEVEEEAARLRKLLGSTKTAPARRGRKKMTAAEKLEVSKRMKKRWKLVKMAGSKTLG